MNGGLNCTLGSEVMNMWRAMDNVIQGVRIPTDVIHPTGLATGEILGAERLELLREGVRLMVQQFSTGEEYADVVEAYDAGLSSGFYMKKSAIAQGFRQVTAKRFVNMRQQHRRAYAIALRKIYAVGLEQGRLLAAGMWDE